MHGETVKLGLGYVMSAIST